jgi:CRP/FNR family transcriptional regulator, dissimilatory nitrate respiration regulator
MLPLAYTVNSCANREQTGRLRIALLTLPRGVGDRTISRGSMPIESLSDRRLVRASPIFEALPPPIVDDILSDCQLEEHAARACLFNEGEPAQAFFIMLQGWVKLYRITAAGDEVVVGMLRRGQSFADAAGLAGRSYPANGEAVTKMRLVRVPADRLRRRILDHPEIGLSLISATAEHLHQLVSEIAELKAHTGAQRVAEFLLSFVDGDRGPCTIALPFKKTLIAGWLGMKQETLSRAFARLRAEGVVVQGSRVKIADIGQLRTYVPERVSEKVAGAAPANRLRRASPRRSHVNAEVPASHLQNECCCGEQWRVRVATS